EPNVEIAILRLHRVRARVAELNREELAAGRLERLLEVLPRALRVAAERLRQARVDHAEEGEAGIVVVRRIELGGALDQAAREGEREHELRVVLCRVDRRAPRVTGPEE